VPAEDALEDTVVLIVDTPDDALVLNVDVEAGAITGAPIDGGLAPPPPHEYKPKINTVIAGRTRMLPALVFKVRRLSRILGAADIRLKGLESLSGLN
jgi:hypothetical protein